GRQARRDRGEAGEDPELGPQQARRRLLMRSSPSLSAGEERTESYPKPIAFSMLGGISSRPAASSAARSILMASRSRSSHEPDGPGGIALGLPLASTHARR